MRMKFVGLLGALALTGMAKPASAIDRTLELSVPKDGSTFGAGYSSVKKEFKRTCVKFTPDAFTGGEGGQAESHWKDIQNNSQLSDEMNVGVHAAFGVAMAVASLKVDSKVSFMSKKETNFFSQTILAVYRNLNVPKSIKGDITLKDEYKELAKTSRAKFKEECGDYFVMGVQEGAEFYGTVQFEIRDASLLTDFNTSLDVKGSYGPYNAELGLDYARKTSSKSKNIDLKVDIVSTGGNKPASTLDELEREFKAFSEKGAKVPVKFIAVPYESKVAGWPTGDPLAPTTDDDKIDKLVEVAFALKALVVDLKFIKTNEKLFALGTTKESRRKSLAKVEAAISKFDGELKRLQKSAQGCDTEFGKNCEELYAKYENWDTAEKYVGLPARYTSSCGDVTLQATNWQKFPTTIDVTDRDAKGHDGSFGHNPVKFTADLTLAAKGRAIEANMSITAAEWNTKKKGLFTKKSEVGKRDTSLNQDTSYSGSSGKTEVFKLESTMGGPDLSQCSFDTPAFEGSGKGSLNETTGVKPAEGKPIVIDKGQKGILRKMSCMLSKKGKDGASCTSFDISDVKIKLVSEQDREVDKGQGGIKKAANYKPRARKKSGSSNSASKKKGN